MGMGYGANYADVMQDSDVAKICPKEHKKLLDNLKRLDIGLNEFGADLMNEIDLDKILVKSYNDLCKSFLKKTGLEIALDFHSSEDGDRYDEIDGAFWSIYGMYTLTLAGRKCNNLVERKFYVTYG